MFIGHYALRLDAKRVTPAVADRHRDVVAAR